MFGLEPGVLVAVSVGVILVLVEAYLLVSIYRKCPPNQAMIVSGMYAGTPGSPGNSYRIIVGGGAIILPLIQQVNYLSLELTNIQIKTQDPILTSDGVPVSFELIAQIKVKGDDVSIATAAECFLGKSAEEIDVLAANIILASLRSAVANLAIDQLRSGVDELVLASNAELCKIGLTCVSLTVRNLTELPKRISSKSESNEGVASHRSANTVDLASRPAVLAEYQRAMPILEQQVGAQSVVFKEFLLRFAAIIGEADDYLSREKAEQIRLRANKIQSTQTANFVI